MGESERTNKKLNSWFWFLMYILPIIVMIFAIWKTQDTVTIENVEDYINAFLNINIIPGTSEIKTSFLSILETMFGQSAYISAAVSMGMYMCVVKIVHLITDLIMLLPDMALSLCNKATGGKNL